MRASFEEEWVVMRKDEEEGDGEEFSLLDVRERESGSSKAPVSQPILKSSYRTQSSNRRKGVWLLPTPAASGISTQIASNLSSLNTRLLNPSDPSFRS